MTINKADLVNSVIDKVRFKKQNRERQQYLFPELNYTFLSRNRATNIVNSLFEIIKLKLEKGENVLISGFGKFHVNFKCR